MEPNFKEGEKGMLSKIKLENINLATVTKIILVTAVLLLLISPDVSFAATSTGQVQSKLKSGITSIQAVLTSIVVLIGVVAGIKTVIKHLPSIDDPHVKNDMWRGLGQILLGVIAGAALVWVVPWVYGLFQ